MGHRRQAAGRRAFSTLAGPTPVLPDWAFGVWYTYWFPYNQSFARAEIRNWTSHRLPLDVRACACSAHTYYATCAHAHMPHCSGGLGQRAEPRQCPFVLEKRNPHVWLQCGYSRL